MAEPAKPKRRMVKKVETVREKTAKSAEVKPKKQKGITSLALSYVAAPFKWAGRQVAKLERFKAFRVLGLILWPPYFRNSWKELRQVTWPGRRETWHLTGAVIIFAIIFGALVAGVDFGLDKIFRKIIIE